METDYKYRNVMLVDDVELDNFVSKTILKAYYFCRNFYLHNSAVSALSFLKTLEGPNATAFPNVIFIDINMPGRDGFQFIKDLKQEFNNQLRLFKPKLVILTSSIFDSDRQKAKENFEDIIFIVKPLTPEALLMI